MCRFCGCAQKCRKLCIPLGISHFFKTTLLNTLCYNCLILLTEYSTVIWLVISSFPSFSFWFASFNRCFQLPICPGSHWPHWCQDVARRGVKQRNNHHLLGLHSSPTAIMPSISVAESREKSKMLRIFSSLKKTLLWGYGIFFLSKAYQLGNFPWMMYHYFTLQKIEWPSCWSP